LSVLRRIVQLGLAALVASACGGLLFLPLLGATTAVVALLDGSGLALGSAAEAIPIALLFLMIAPAVIGPAVALGCPPAFVAGTILHAAGRSRLWARRRTAWAAAGAAVAGAVWLRVYAVGTGLTLFGGSGTVPAAIPAFLLAGAGAGLVYRSAALLAAPFLGLDGEEEEEE
jgi:hypothetical protein